MFSSYFQDRRQRVIQTDKTSATLPNTIGVPQGTILGPILFSIYINDLPSILQYSSCLLFADDNNIFQSSKIENVVKMMNDSEKDLENINKWINANYMKLNISKTKMCIFATKSTMTKIDQAGHPLTLNFMNNCVTLDSDIKCMGLILDKQLTWKQHITTLCSKLNYNLNSIRTFQPFLEPKHLHILVSYLFLFHVFYMTCLWGQACTTALKPIEKSIRRGARLILGKSKYDRILYDLTTNFKWLMPHNLYKYKMCNFLSEIINLKSIIYFENMLEESSSIYNTRCKSKYFKGDIPMNDFGTRQICNVVNTLWKTFPEEIKESELLFLKK